MSNNSFALDISAFVAKSRDKADLIVRKVGIDILTRVVMRSPVRSGRFRANWQVALNSPPAGTLASADKSGADTIAKGAETIAGAKAGGMIWLVNNLPYARRLEYGYSKQAPAGMVRVTVAEFNASVHRANKEQK
jgi:hypothetical protein